MDNRFNTMVLLPFIFHHEAIKILPLTVFDKREKEPHFPKKGDVMYRYSTFKHSFKPTSFPNLNYFHFLYVPLLRIIKTCKVLPNPLSKKTSTTKDPSSITPLTSLDPMSHASHPQIYTNTPTLHDKT